MPSRNRTGRPLKGYPDVEHAAPGPSSVPSAESADSENAVHDAIYTPSLKPTTAAQRHGSAERL